MGPTPVDIGAIAREHYDAVFRFCARRVGYESAADAAQDTFLTAHRVARKYRGDSSVSTWLFGIAHNECRRIARSRRLDAPRIDFVDEHAQESQESRLIDRTALSDALLRLSSEHRDVVLLHELEGLTYEEAASVLDIPVGTVKSRLHHAFLQLRKALQPTGGEVK
ncbi:MAG TPA: RNA polymerase sigma factor [Fimbriimonas sp.]